MHFDTKSKGVINTIRTLSPEETHEEGKNLASILNSGDIVALTGELGAGKTIFTQGICDGLKVSDSVISPTFTILNEYEGKLPVFHFDAYRLSGPDDILATGFGDYLLREGVCIIEWAEKVKEVIPVSAIWVYINQEQAAENLRELKIHLPEKVID
ncbi:MAG: tRNA (adenosine(37)-N6)-threonylcarbamoyltransferase complex ATPase subunit type 1 TsaE [Candidatus Marinimicrobia bacterium]|nr:tRNA (adenosine(37)-N6)-threonylcarbamoyltransferase complex ATPase subunit type 1 TsaE [Candidatus Neomarinimicrobiota bacterium]